MEDCHRAAFQGWCVVLLGEDTGLPVKCEVQIKGGIFFSFLSFFFFFILHQHIPNIAHTYPKTYLLCI